MTEHAIRASGSVTVELWDIDGNGDAGEILVQDMDIEDTTARCICGADFDDLKEARSHMFDVGVW